MPADPIGLERVALIVFHGMGQQREYETLATVSNALDPRSPEVARADVFCAAEDDRPVSYATLAAGDQPVDIFEAYWSPWTKGKVNFGHVLRFLFDAGWRGLRISVGNYFTRSNFRRTLFGKTETYPLPASTPVVLLGLLAFILSFIVVAIAFAWVGVGYGLMMLGLRVFDQCLLRDLRTWLYMSTLVDLVILGFAALVLLVSSVLRRSFPKTAVAKPQGFILYFLVGLLMLVQVVSAVALGFCVHSYWKDHEGRPSPITTPSYCQGPPIDHVLESTLDLYGGRLRPIIYPVGHGLSLGWLLMTLFSLGVTSLYLLLPPALTAVLGDLVAYLTAYRANEFFSLREEIRRRCYGLCREVLHRKDARDQPYYRHIVIAGHSLGSVIAYDALNHLLREEEIAAGAPLEQTRFRGLITLGSPLDKAAFLFGYEAEGHFNVRTRILSSVQPLISNAAIRESVPWVNFWSRLDPVSARLDYYDPPGYTWPGEVVNIHDDLASMPLWAHVTYWRNPVLQQTLRAFCQPARYSPDELRNVAG